MLLAATAAFFVPAISDEGAAPSQQVRRVVQEVGNPKVVSYRASVRLTPMFKVGDKVTVALVCWNRKPLAKALHHIHVLKDTKSKAANQAVNAARCYRVHVQVTVNEVGKAFGPVRVYGITLPNGAKAWSFGPK